jgi:hypothetical protein
MEDWYTGDRIDAGKHAVELTSGSIDLNPVDEPVKTLRAGWWQRVNRTPTGWTLTRADEAWVQLKEDCAVLVVDYWIWGPQIEDRKMIVLVPRIGIIMVPESALK